MLTQPVQRDSLAQALGDFNRPALGLALAVAGASGVAIATLRGLDLQLAVLGTGLALLVVVLAFRQPLVAVLAPLVYFNNPLERLIGLPDLSPYSYVPAAALIGISSLLAVHALTTGRMTRQPTPVDIPVLTFAVISGAGAAWGLLRHSQLQLIAGDLFQYLEFCLSFFVASTFIKTFRDSQVVLVVILIVSLLGAVADLGLILSGRTYLLQDPSTLDAPPRVINALASLQLPVVLAYFLHSGGIRRVLMGLSILLLTVDMIASQTRGLWIAAIVAVLFIALTLDTWRRRALLVGSAVAGLSAVMLVSASLHGIVPSSPNLRDVAESRITYTYQQVLAPVDPVQQRRLIEADIVLRSAAQAPIYAAFGYGLGSTYIGPTGSSLAELYVGHRHYIHDHYLAVLFRLGLVGLLSYLAIAVVFIISAVWTYRRAPPGLTKAAAVGLAAGYVAVATFSITSDTLLRHPIAMFVGLAMAIVYRVPTASPPQPSAEPIAVSDAVSPARANV